MTDWISSMFIIAGVGFFLAGTVGLLRFPDVFTRLHALTKADNTGLGLLGVGVALQGQSLRLAVLIGLIWFLAVTASSIACHLVARHNLHSEEGER